MKEQLNQFVREEDLQKEAPEAITYCSCDCVDLPGNEIYRIKTVVDRIKRHSRFDRDVNFYLNLGFKLVDRYIDGKFLIAELVLFKPTN